MNKLSIYKGVTDVDSTEMIDIDLFLDGVKEGTWQDAIFKLRNTKDEETYNRLKKGLPIVTVSGLFSRRQDNALVSHSGFLCIDIDKMDPNEAKSILCADEYTYAAFTSCSGNGLAILVKINPEHHRDIFRSLSEYYFKKYQIIVDPTAINPSRSRFVSFDPDLFLNPSAKKYTHVKKEVKQSITKIVFVKNDFEAIIKQLQNKGIDLTFDYEDWRNIGFGLADKFGEDGRSYFHQISEISTKYNSNICDRQYNACLRAYGQGVTIATFYWLAKKAGIETYSTQTKEIIKVVGANRRAGIDSDEAIISNLVANSEFTQEAISEIVSQVGKDLIIADISLVEQLETEIRTSWNIKRNVITRALDLDGKRMEQRHFNTIYLTVRKNIEKTSYDLIERIIISESTPEFNPLMDFISQNKGKYNETGLIDKLSDVINSEYGLIGNDKTYFIKKWYVGMIASIHGDHSPLFLVLTGIKQNTGKTQFFRRLLPKELKEYYAESKLDKEKDDEILMTQKLLIMDDEMGGKSKKQTERLKELTSKDTFTLREPYGRSNVDLKRLAVLAGTSNEDDIINDPAGNRRMIPINVASLDHNLYNSIDKAALFIEAYRLWQDGFTHELNADDISLLNSHTTDFEDKSSEEELLFKYFRIPQGNEGEWHTATDILVKLETYNKLRLSPKKIGMILRRYGVDRKSFLRNNQICKGYLLVAYIDDRGQDISDDVTNENVVIESSFGFMPSDNINSSKTGNIAPEYPDPNCPF